MSTFTPPIVAQIVPTWDADSSKLQVNWAKWFVPRDRGANVFVLSDNTVVSDWPVTLSDSTQSSTNIPYPWVTNEVPLVGPPEGAEGGPYGVMPYYRNFVAYLNPPESDSVQAPYIKYWFAGAHGPYHNISANLVAILTAAKFDNYLS